jgi:hypothetical protein
MVRRKSFMESLLQLKHRDLATGYLSKLTTKGRWQERWFVVHGHYLSYFRKHLETSQHVGLIPSPAGSINLWHVTQVTLDQNKVRLTDALVLIINYCLVIYGVLLAGVHVHVYMLLYI